MHIYASLKVNYFDNKNYQNRNRKSIFKRPKRNISNSNQHYSTVLCVFSPPESAQTHHSDTSKSHYEPPEKPFLMSQKGFSVKQNKPFLDSQASYTLIINELTNQHDNRIFVSKTSFLYFGSNLIDLTENKYAEPHIRSAYLYTYIPFHQSVSGCRSSSVFRANVRLTALRIYSKVVGYS